MKTHTPLFIIFIFLFGCVGSSKLSNTGNKEKQIIKDVIETMISGGQVQINKKARPLISPKYLQENNINVEDYNINLYYPKGYSIESYNNQTGIIVAEIWGSNHDWTHRLEFKLVKEKGKLYLYPEKHTTSNYLYPWYKSETYINK